jgi:hypothetical protein
MKILLVPQSHPDRACVEAGIADAYRRVYGASLRAFAPVLVAAFDRGGPVAAAGLRFGREPFFSEIYLDRPIESVIGAVAGKDPPRERIVEISSLAAMETGAASPFLHGIIDLCCGAGFEWAFFTATAPLRRLLTRAGILAVDLAPARQERIADPFSWGTYYNHRPRVVAVHHRTNIARNDTASRTGTAAHA